MDFLKRFRKGDYVTYNGKTVYKGVISEINNSDYPVVIEASGSEIKIAKHNLKFIRKETVMETE